MRPNPDKPKITLKVAPWEGINPLCDERIGRVHDRAGVSVIMSVDKGQIHISAKLSRERLKELLEEEGIEVIY